ncbi:hypothetical protein GCM10022237_48610 [Nocardioides ginsengisoli]|uniref:Phage major capsid protein n=1 Tax=Nocardioides ginsengisoli TaxID=363868 RepID=A0ABW3W4K3_9ACTN
MTTNVGNSPELVTEIVQRILVTPLQEASAFLSSGVRIFESDGSPVRVPKINGFTNPPVWVTENGNIPTNLDADFDEVRLLERTVKSLAGIATFSESLLRQSVVNVEAAIRDQLVFTFADKIDQTFFAGTGGTGGDEPLGMLNWADTQDLTAVGALTNFDPLLDALGLALAASVDATRLQWFMRPETFTKLSKLKDGQQRYQLTPDPTEGGKFRLHGYPVTVTKKIPVVDGTTDTTSICLADMSTVAVARDRNAEVIRLGELYRETQRIGLRVLTRMDCAPLLPEAVVILRGVNL